MNGQDARLPAPGKEGMLVRQVPIDLTPQRLPTRGDDRREDLVGVQRGDEMNGLGLGAPFVRSGPLRKRNGSLCRVGRVIWLARFTFEGQVRRQDFVDGTAVLPPARPVPRLSSFGSIGLPTSGLVH